MTLQTPLLGLDYPQDSESPNGPAQIQALALDVEGAITSVLSRWEMCAQANQVIPSGTATGLYIAGGLKRSSSDAQSGTLPVHVPVALSEIGVVDLGGISGHHLRKTEEDAITGFKPVYRLNGAWELPDTASLSGATRVRIVLLKPPVHDDYAGILQTALLSNPTADSHGALIQMITSTGIWDPTVAGSEDGFYVLGFEVSGAATNARTGFNIHLQRRYIPE